VNGLKRLHIALTLGLLIIFLAVQAYAIEWDNSKFMPLSEIKPGMKGICKTVFSGTNVEEFNIEIISIEKNYLPQWDVIWTRGSGGSFDETGIAGGMSGSPVYIDNRLIGAVSLGSYFQKKGDIFGVTPIELMINVTKRGMKPKLSYGSGGGYMPFFAVTSRSPDSKSQSHLYASDGQVVQVPDLGSMSYGSASLSAQERQPENYGFNPYFDRRVTQAQTPVTFAGFSQRAIGFMKPILERYGMYPIQGGGGGSVDVEVPIEPGQVLGMEYARGDFTAFGYGTLTYRENDQFIAYGHPMMGEGNVNLPISIGYVHYILPSIQRSSKVASPVKPIGTLVQDRIPAIAGLIGKSPRYIPVSLKLKAADGIKKEFHYEVMQHRDFSAGMAMSGVWSLIDGADREFGDYTVHTQSSIALKDLPAITKDNFYSGSASPGFAAVQSISALSSLIRNSYQKVEVEKVDIEVSIEDKRNAALIEKIQISKNRYKPGEEVQISITLRPYLEEPVVQKASITIPKDTPNGLLGFLVASASSHESWQRSRAPLNFRPKNIHQLIKLLQRGESNNYIMMELYTSKLGMTIEGKELPELPISMLSVLTYPTKSGDGGFTRGTTLLVDKLQTKYFILGSMMLRLIVDRNAP